MSERLRAEQIRQLPRRADGLFELGSVDGNIFRAAGQVYPVYAAYETDCNGKEGYPDLLAQVRILYGELEKEDTPENRVLFLEGLLGTIENVSPQLYEYYREMADLFRKVLKKALDRGQDPSGRQGGENSAEMTEALGRIAARAAELYLLNEEKYCMTVSGGDGCAEKAEAAAQGRSAGTAVDSRAAEAAAQGQACGNGAVEVKLLMTTSRSAVIEIADGGKYFSKSEYRIFLNGSEIMTAGRTIVSLYDLKPDSDYRVDVFAGTERKGGTEFRTKHEFVTLDVRRFGAKGDGMQDDTPFIQAAILACPGDSRVLIPAGTYRIASLFLKSHIRLELAEGAELKAFTEKEKFPAFPGVIESWDGESEYNLGSWEGNPLPMYTGIICGVGVEDVVIYGRGTIDGNASKANWWKDPKGYKDVFRPRLFFINQCKDVTLQGVTFCNSPSWTLHPYFSDGLRFIDLNVLNPADSPNTDGCDPESCKNVDILGVRFSLGDDCIAVKSGKIYMGRKYKRPSENIRVRQCLMENGHGAVTLGSEMAGGVIGLTVEDCIFRHTDRGLRVKTRRGRGKDAILDNIIFRNLELDHVMTPLVVNSFYFCDPDGKTAYVQSREACAVDDRTPSIKKLVFEDMKCTNCHVAAAYFDGLPEQKIEEIVMRNIFVSYADEPKCDVPAMSVGVPKSSKRGLFARNVRKLTLENVVVQGAEGQICELAGVDEVVGGADAV